MSYPEYELDMEMVERQRLKELVRVRSKPLSIDIETTSVEDFKDLTGVIANVIVVWDSVSPMKKWVFVQDEALHLNDVLPMSALRNHLIEWLKRGRVLGGQNILGFDFPVMMDDDNLKVKDVLQAFIDTRQIVDTSKYISDRYGFRVSLKYMAGGSLGDEKLMDGANAPIEWANGNYQDVVDYCIKDTILWSEIHQFGVERGYVNIGGPKLTVDW
jgi:hypothetical protein|tara:strand:+ start:308 stop:952 length:645 start_codon:yes stop_codon:yes gene_type:complete